MKMYRLSKLRGQALVEFAIVSVIFFTLVFGIFQSVLLINAKIMLKYAAYVTARHALINSKHGKPDMVALHRRAFLIMTSVSIPTIQYDFQQRALDELEKLKADNNIDNYEQLERIVLSESFLRQYLLQEIMNLLNVSNKDDNRNNKTSFALRNEINGIIQFFLDTVFGDSMLHEMSQKLDRILTAYFYTDVKLTLISPSPDNPDLHTITSTVTFKYRFVFPFVSRLATNIFPLSQSVTLRSLVPIKYNSESDGEKRAEFKGYESFDAALTNAIKNI